MDNLGIKLQLSVIIQSLANASWKYNQSEGCQSGNELDQAVSEVIKTALRFADELGDDA